MKISVDEQVLALAESYLKAALDDMRQHSVVMAPENIMVWYHFKQGDMPQLTKEMERLIARDVSFTPHLCSQLYQRFFTEIDRRKLDLLREAMRQLIGHLMEHIQSVGDDVEGYQSSLSQCIDALEDDPDEEQMKSLVSIMLSQSRKALDKSRAASTRMQTLSKEVSQLRSSMKDLERSALEDSLTGVANRRAFDLKFVEQFEGGEERKGRRCCLLLVDIDYFKHFNDEYGHLEGDKALRYVALMLKDMIKGQDFLSRYGGEEFAIILPNTEYGGAIALAASIAERMASTSLALGSGERIDPITVSIGVSASSGGDTPEKLFRRADASLYLAKDRGRNSVVGEKDLAVDT